MAARRFVATGLALVVALAAVVLLAQMGEPPTPPVGEPPPRSGDAEASEPDRPDEAPPSGPEHEEPADLIPPPTATRFLYTDEEVVAFRERMSGDGPFFALGDAGHGGPDSPADGERSLRHARAFLSSPLESYWSQDGLPYSPGDPAPLNMRYVRPMHAAWVYMTLPTRADREDLGNAVKELLLVHAQDPTLDFSNSDDYPVGFAGEAANPIFEQAQWLTRLFKARDMLGREAFADDENAVFDQWLYGYANWTAKWLHEEAIGRYLPGRLDRDYTVVRRAENAGRQSFDGGPLIGDMALTYTNRHAAPASAMSLAANYLAAFGYDGTTRSDPAYGRFSVEELLDHSRLFVEETLRFSVFPEGVQGDFERADADYHGAKPQQGWLYAINVLSNLVDIADHHARRGDMILWEYGTTEGYDGTEGAPTEGGFEEKNLHFFAWSMSRYANGGWDRTVRGEPLVLSHFYHDVIPAAIANRYHPEDDLLEAAWRREGAGFAPYPVEPQSQGPWPAFYGEGARHVGLIEHAP